MEINKTDGIGQKPSLYDKCLSYIHHLFSCIGKKHEIFNEEMKRDAREIHVKFLYLKIINRNNYKSYRNDIRTYNKNKNL